MSFKAVVCDLDGTLANVGHRVHLVRQDSKQFDEFYARAKDDEINDWCRVLINSVQGHYRVPVWIVSARPKTLKDVTKKWLADNGVHYEKLFLLREDEKDNTPDQELKRKWLWDNGGPEKILFVVDDRKRVIDMWRAEGVTCLQCADWPEYKKTEKEPEK